MADVVATHPVVRVAGMPATVLARLRQPATSAVTDRIGDTDAWLSAESGDISDRLYKVIGALSEADRQWKPALVGLRRAIFRGRRPSHTEWTPELRQLLPAALRQQIERWVTTHQGRQADYQSLHTIYASEIERSYLAVRDLAGDPFFRRGLWHASPDLTQALDSWLVDPARVPPRRVVLRLAKYLARAATKTSPFSTFTYLSFARWQHHVGPARALRLDPAPVLQGVLQFRHATRSALVRALTGDRSRWRYLSVVLNPSATAEDGRISFLGPPPREQLACMPLTPTLRTCLTVLADRRPETGAEYLELLRRAGNVADGHLHQLQELLAHLLGTGLLLLRPPVAQSAPAGNLGLARWAAPGTDSPDELDRLLQRLDATARRAAPVDDVAAYRALHRELRGLLSAAEQASGQPVRPEVAEVPVTHDNIVATTGAGSFDRGQWTAALQDLDGLRTWMAVLDDGLPLKLGTARWFATRFGTGEVMPLLRFYRHFFEALAEGTPECQELAQYWYPGSATKAGLASSDFPQVRELHVLRQQLKAAFQRQPEPDGIIRVDSAELIDIAHQWPVWAAPINSMACYVQPFQEESARLKLAVNVITSGHGRGSSRVAGLLREAGTAVYDGSGAGASAAPDDGGQVVAELAGLFDAPIEMAPPTARYEIDYPSAVCRQPPERRLRFEDLSVRYDQRRGLLTLHSQRLESAVEVSRPGLIMTQFLPPAARLLASLFSQLGASGVRLMRPPEEAPSLVEAYYCPRIEVGDLVVRRACWVVPWAEIPKRASGAGDIDYFMELTSFRRAHGMPDRCFATGAPTSWSPEARREEASSRHAHKPAFVDFTSGLLMLSFEKMMRTPRSVVIFSEALPDPDRTQWLTGVPRATELLLEVPAGIPRASRRQPEGTRP